MAIKKGGVSLLFLIVILFKHNSAQPQTPDNFQQVFNDGVTAMFNGQYDQSIKIFEDLYNRTKSPRVKLEWARSAFLAKKYNLSSKLFNEVLDLSVPDSVKFNISLYLNEIKKLGDFTDYSISFIRDTNPFLTPESQKIFIFGIPFDYTPPTKKETLDGIRVNFYHSKLINTDGKIRAIFDGNINQYEGRKNLKYTLRAKAQFKSNLYSNFSYDIGTTFYGERGDSVLTQPFTVINYRSDNLPDYFQSKNIELKFAKNMYNQFSEIKSNTTSLYADATKTMNQSLQIKPFIYVENTSGNYQNQNYTSILGGIAINVHAPIIKSNIKIEASASDRKFNKIDELFLTKRKDERNVYSVTISPYNFKIGNLYTDLTIENQDNRSTIPINTYKKTALYISLKKNY